MAGIGPCAKIGAPLRLRGRGFGRRGQYRLQIGPAEGGAPGVNVIVRSWSDRTVLLTIPPNPQIRADGETPYRLLLMGRRGETVATLSQTFAVCR